MARSLGAIRLTCRSDDHLDWAQTARAIEALDLKVLETGDDFFPEFLHGFPEDLDPPAALGVYRLLKNARESLSDDAALVRGAIEAPASALAVLEAGDWRTYLVLTFGSADEGELPYALAALSEGGLAEATGFRDWGRYSTVDLEDRALSFSSEELAVVRGAHAWLFAEDAARAMLSDFAATSTEHWPEVWLQPLRESDSWASAAEAERALFRFLAGTLAILLVLVRRAEIDEQVWLAEMIELMDTQVPSAAENAADLAHHLLAHDTAFFADALAALDADPQGETLRNLTAWTGIPAAHSLSIELCTGVLLPSLLCIALLAGEGLADIRPHFTHTPVPPRDEPESSARLSLIDEMGWCAFPTFDWSAAEDAIERRPAPEREPLRTDLGVVREAMDGKRIGYATQFVACGHTYLCGLGDARDGWSLVLSLRRLGQAGVLEAAGAAAWG